MGAINVDRVINLQKKLVPEMMQMLTERYKVLRQVSHDAPIGRRTLAKKLELSERTLRGHVDFLKEAGLLDFTLAGMQLTGEGMTLLEELREYVSRLQRLSSLEQILRDKLHLQLAMVLPGDADQDPVVVREIGRVAAGLLLRLLSDHKAHVVAVTGGTTVAAMAENIYGSEPLAVIVPARGGLGDKMELQANTVATVLAGRLKCKYLQLYVPDSVSETVLRKILEEDNRVKQVVETIKSADILVHGIGQASVMAAKRGVASEIAENLKQHGAVGEALGQYFNIKGEVVHSTDTLGLMVNDLASVHTVMGIGGGHSKGKAILAVLRSGQQDILVTDEAAAREIIHDLESPLDSGGKL